MKKTERRKKRNKERREGEGVRKGGKQLEHPGFASQP